MHHHQISVYLGDAVSVMAEVLDVGDQAAAEIFTAAFAPLAPEERDVLLNLLRRVSEASPTGIPISPGIPPAAPAARTV